MSASDLDGDFRSYTLTRQIDSAGHIDPETELWVEGSPTTESFRVWFKATSSPVIAAQVGADAQSTAVRGRMLEPLEPPSTAASGAEYAVGGTSQKLTVIWLPPSPIADIDESLGRAWVGRLS